MGVSLSETTAVTAPNWEAEAADELSPIAFDDFASSAAAERSLIAALSAALVTHRMDLLTIRRDR